MKKTGTTAREGAAGSDEASYDGLQCYTLALGDDTFIHQHVVDAWTAQRAHAATKPIALTFALVGLHLHVVEGLSGRQVQRVHMALARRRTAWPAFPLPPDRGAITPRAVMAAPAGPERDRAIDAWCASVWDAYRESHGAVAALVARHRAG